MFEITLQRCVVAVLAVLALAPCLAADALIGLVDPTRPLDFNAGMQDINDSDAQVLSGFVSYRLNSVLIRPNDRIAVVNGQRVRIGDMLGAARVAGIDQDGVILDINGEATVLALYGEPVKTLVAAGHKQ